MFCIISFLTDGVKIQIDLCYKCFDLTKANYEKVRFNWDTLKKSPIYPEFKLGNGEGVVCHNCFAYFGTQIDFELEFTSAYLKRFKVTYGGTIGMNYNITLDDPTFPTILD